MKTMTIAQWICYLGGEIEKLKEKKCKELLTGDYPPCNSQGKDGDTYLQLCGGYIYEKEHGVWCRRGQIKYTAINGGEF